MRAVVQRVTGARVEVAGETVASIGPGLLVLVGVRDGDGEADAAYIADKVANLRIFEDETGKLNRSVLDTGGAVLIVSQFTLYADGRKGRRPSFTEAAGGDGARRLYERVCELAAAAGVPVMRGAFGEHMRVELVNDGPVTILLDSSRTF